MFGIFGSLCFGIFLGWLLRRSGRTRPVARRVVGLSILSLMLFLGIEVGGNRTVLDHLDTIGLTALVLGVGTVAGTLVAARLLWRCGFRSVAPKSESPTVATDDSRQAVENDGGAGFSLTIVGILAGGIALGLWTPAPRWIGNGTLALGALYLLMFAVGVTVGGDTDVLRSLARQPKRSLLVPLATFVGSWVGVSAAWGALRLAGGTLFGWSEAMAVGSGQAYYSLSGVLLSELRGAELGTVALLANIARELLTVVGAGWMVRRFSPLGPICAGGATTMDVSLPGILRHCGPQYLPLALLQGAVADLSVPLLVPFFAGL